MISLGLFGIFVSIAVGGFARALRAQRQVAGIIAANSNVSLTIEQMAREFRTGVDFCVGTTAAEPECLSLNPCGFTISSCLEGPTLAFRNARDELVAYQWNSATGAVERRCDAGGGGCVVGNDVFEPITAENVEVTNMQFLIQGDNISYPQRLTVTVTVRPRDISVPAGVGETTLQTTVSPRLL
jgi:hypothetical protein